MTAEADYVYRPFRASWFRIGLSDTAAFDLWLAQAVVIRNGLFHEPNAFNYDAKYLDTFEASKYYCKSLHQLALRLNNREDCISDGVIATIMGFICVDVRFLLLLILSLEMNKSNSQSDSSRKLGSIYRAYGWLGANISSSPWV